MGLPFLFLAIFITLIELVDATGGIDEFDFSCVEWVRSVRDLDLDDWVSYTVHLKSVLGGGAGTRNEYGVV